MNRSISGKKNWFSIQKAINITHYINRIKCQQNHSVISIAKKDFDKIQHSQDKNTPAQNRKKSPQMIKDICEKNMANILQNDETVKLFSPKIKNKTRYLLLPFLFSIVVEVVARKFKQGKEIKGIQTEKKEENYLYLQVA